jgi:hypothetical protein
LFALARERRQGLCDGCAIDTSQVVPSSLRLAQLRADLVAVAAHGFEETRLSRSCLSPVPASGQELPLATGSFMATPLLSLVTSGPQTTPLTRRAKPWNLIKAMSMNRWSHRRAAQSAIRAMGSSAAMARTLPSSHSHAPWQSCDPLSGHVARLPVGDRLECPSSRVRRCSGAAFSRTESSQPFRNAAIVGLKSKVSLKCFRRAARMTRTLAGRSPRFGGLSAFVAS